MGSKPIAIAHGVKMLPTNMAETAIALMRGHIDGPALFCQ